MRRLVATGTLISTLAILAVASTVVLYFQIRRAARQTLERQALDRASAVALAARAASVDDGVLDRIAGELIDGATVRTACVLDPAALSPCAGQPADTATLVERALTSDRPVFRLQPTAMVARLGALELWYPLSLEREPTFAPGPVPSSRRVLLIVVDPARANELVTQTLVHAGILTALLLTLVVLTVLQMRSIARERALEHRLAEERRFTELGRLSGVLAHEIRNPLGAIKGFAQLTARRFTDDDPARQDLDTIVSESTRLERLVQSLLLYARPPEARLERVSLQGVLERAVRLVGAPDGRVTLDAPEPLLFAHVDPELLTQALLNLVRNAVEAVEDAEGHVWVRLSADGVARITVEDDGPGVPLELAADLFEPYVTRKARGTGLGLAVTRRVAQAHGGTVRHEPRPGGGARFVLELPGLCA